MPEATPPSPAEMVSAIEIALAESPAGTVEAQFDSTRVKWDRRQALDELRYWRSRVAAEADATAGRSSLTNRFTGVDISGGI